MSLGKISKEQRAGNSIVWATDYLILISREIPTGVSNGIFIPTDEQLKQLWIELMAYRVARLWELKRIGVDLG